jgi:hypothetical protein
LVGWSAGLLVLAGIYLTESLRALDLVRSGWAIVATGYGEE